MYSIIKQISQDIENNRIWKKKEKAHSLSKISILAIIQIALPSPTHTSLLFDLFTHLNNDIWNFITVQYIGSTFLFQFPAINLADITAEWYFMVAIEAI